MKLLLIPYLLLSICLSSQATNLAAVGDIDGRSLLAGHKYYILPLIRGRGGGLTLAAYSNDTCPLYVAQENFEVKTGLPVIFSPVNPKDKLVRESTDFNVQADAVTVCAQSTVWRLGDVVAAGDSKSPGRRYVVTGGVKGKPGLGTVSNWFRIESNGERVGYKLVFCPGVCKFCKVLCGDVGVFVEGGKRWLGLSGDPFPVVFKKVQ